MTGKGPSPGGVYSQTSRKTLGSALGTFTVCWLNGEVMIWQETMDSRTMDQDGALRGEKKIDAFGHAGRKDTMRHHQVSSTTDQMRLASTAVGLHMIPNEVLLRFWSPHHQHGRVNRCRFVSHTIELTLFTESKQPSG